MKRIACGIVNARRPSSSVVRAVAALASVAFVSNPASAKTIVRSNAAVASAAIDAVCDYYNARSAVVRRVQLARVRSGTGPARWKVSSDAALAKLQSAGSIDADFADVFSRDGKIVYAIFTRGDVTGDGGDAREYCYINEKLARAAVRYVDASLDRAVSRTLYYGANGALFIDTGSVVRDIGEERRTIPDPSPPPLTIVAYPTPKTLPFYGAYRSALAGALPSL